MPPFFLLLTFALLSSAVIDAWSRRPGKDTAERAEQILRRLVTNHRVTNNRFLAPDVITYTGVMKAYVNHPKGGLKALGILEEMNNQCIDGNRKARPDIQALAVAMDACAKSGLTSAAEGILEGIEDSKKSEVLFNTIISGYKREGRGHEAEAVLRRMISLEKSGWNRCRPDMITYALCIEAVSFYFDEYLILFIPAFFSSWSVIGNSTSSATALTIII